MFAAPPEQTLEWSDEGVEGACRFLRRLWTRGLRARRARAAGEAPLQEPSRFRRRSASCAAWRTQTLAKVTDDYRPPARVQHRDRRGHGAAERSCTRFEDVGDRAARCARKRSRSRCCALADRAARLPRAVAGRSATSDALIDQPWPEPDRGAGAGSIELVVQVNGKLRSKVEVGASASKDEISAAALANATIQKWIEGKPVRKVIVPPGNKLVNVVV